MQLKMIPQRQIGGHMASDVYLQIDGIKGESQDSTQGLD